MSNKRAATIEENLGNGLKAGVIQLTLEDERLDGRFIRINQRKCINFASCSYLGLELDRRIIRGIIAAAQRYGSQFSASRGYLSVTLYRAVEKRLQRICKRPIIVGPSTTLIHQSAIPVLIGDDDAVILDQQVHNSVGAACRALVVRGVPMVMSSHNHMGRLERRIQRLQDKCRNIWYMMDGLYSMSGDFAPVDELAVLLEKYPQLHIYADDAHCAGWLGDNGEGLILNRLGNHPRVVVALSLNKSFATAGGLVALPDTGIVQRIRNQGETLTFSGPIQPPLLGGLCESADIHLSAELAGLQAQLRHKIRFFNDLCEQKGLNLSGRSISPIRFIHVGQTEKAIELTRLLMLQGFFVCVAGYPSVARNKAGLRITITNHLCEADMQDLTDAIAHLVGQARLREEAVEEVA